jgi:hypothetical protein
MDHLTDPTFRGNSDWCEFDADTYLDQRHPNWVLAEHFGDVIFVTERRVVLVHRDRAEHIARALGWRRQAAVPEQAFALPRTFALPPVTPAPPSAPVIVTAVTSPIAMVKATSRWRTACGWLGIMAGAAVFVATLALRLDDPALVVALMLGMRGGRLILVDS